MKNRIKSYGSLAVKLDLFVKLKYQSSAILSSVGNKYSLRDLLCDVINNAWPAM